MFGRKDKIVTETYNSEKAYQKDANKKAKEGYDIKDVQYDEKTGCARWLVIGPLALFFKKQIIRVTFTYELQED